MIFFLPLAGIFLHQRHRTLHGTILTHNLQARNNIDLNFLE